MATLQAGKYAVAARPRMRPSFSEGVLQIAKDLSLPVSLFNWPDGDAVETNTTALAVQAQGETQCDQHPRGTVSATNAERVAQGDVEERVGRELAEAGQPASWLSAVPAALFRGPGVRAADKRNGEARATTQPDRTGGPSLEDHC